MSGFWEHIDRQLDRIELQRPNTVEAVAALLDPPSSGLAFFAGSGGSRQLCESLAVAGWRVDYIESDYHWTARHPVTLQSLEYVEGDIYERTTEVQT